MGCEEEASSVGSPGMNRDDVCVCASLIPCPPVCDERQPAWSGNAS